MRQYDRETDGCNIVPILLGRLSARIDGRPRPGKRCVVRSWHRQRRSASDRRVCPITVIILLRFLVVTGTTPLTCCWNLCGMRDRSNGRPIWRPQVPGFQWCNCSASTPSRRMIPIHRDNGLLRQRPRGGQTAVTGLRGTAFPQHAMVRYVIRSGCQAFRRPSASALPHVRSSPQIVCA